MLKSILFISLFLFANKSFAQIRPWADYMGCFQTIEFNGKPVSTYNPLIGGRIGGVSDRYLVTPDYKLIPILEFHFYQGFDEKKVEHADGGYILLENEDDNGMHFQYDGANLSPIITNPPYIMHLRLDIKWAKPNELLRAHFVRNVESYPDATVNDQYLLKKISCDSNRR